jgi:hypothetical protein
MRGMALSFVIATAMPGAAWAQEKPPIIVTSPEGEADAQRLKALMDDAAGTAHMARLVGGSVALSLGLAEIATGAVLLGVVNDPNLNPIMSVDFFITGALSAAFSLPSFLIRSEMEKLAERSGRDLVDPSIPANERIARAIGGLRTVADQEERGRIIGIISGSVLLVVCGAASTFVFAANIGLPTNYRIGFGTAFAVLGGLDVLILVEAILYHPAESALHTWETGHPKSSLRVRPLIGLTGFGLAGTF